MNTENQEPHLKNKLGVFFGLGVIFFAAIGAHAGDDNFLKINPVFVSNVPESAALSYVNGSNFLFDGKGIAYFSASTRGPRNTPSIAIFRTKKNISTPGFEKFFIEGADSSIDFVIPHIAQTIAFQKPNTLHLVWAGCAQSNDTAAESAHQIRYANISTQGHMSTRLITNPFNVLGYLDVYPDTARLKNPWQNFPSIDLTNDGVLHLVWEARDRFQISEDGRPLSFIAYASRSSSGVWSISGAMDVPPYLSVKGPAQYQSRPSIVAGRDGTLHVFCYGPVNDKNQILYGKLKDRKFSGWSLVAPSNGDQKHVAALVDQNGDLHVVWREEDPEQYSFIAYTTQKKDGSWKEPIKIGNENEYASTPSLAVTDKEVYVVWTGWESGIVNSDDQDNNDFPGDDDTVEGNANISHKPLAQDIFSTPARLTGGIASYPNLAINPLSPSYPSVVWTEGRKCLPRDCVQIFYGAIQPPSPKVKK